MGLSSLFVSVVNDVHRRAVSHASFIYKAVGLQQVSKTCLLCSGVSLLWKVMTKESWTSDLNSTRDSILKSQKERLSFLSHSLVTNCSLGCSGQLLLSIVRLIPTQMTTRNASFWIIHNYPVLNWNRNKNKDRTKNKKEEEEEEEVELLVDTCFRFAALCLEYFQHHLISEMTPIHRNNKTYGYIEDWKSTTFTKSADLYT